MLFYPIPDHNKGKIRNQTVYVCVCTYKFQEEDNDIGTRDDTGVLII